MGAGGGGRRDHTQAKLSTPADYLTLVLFVLLSLLLGLWLIGNSLFYLV